MGLFSRDSTTYVSSVIYPLGAELDKIPDMIQAAVLGSKMRNISTPREIKKTIIDGMGIKLRQAYAYAAKSYYSGLPIGLAHISNSADPAVIATLTTEYLTALYAPSTVLLKSVQFVRTTNHQTVVHQQIETKYNYDFFLDVVHTTVFGLPVESTLELSALQDDVDLHPDEYGWRLTFTKPDTTVVTFDEWYSKTLFTADDDLIKTRLFIEVSIGDGPTQTLSYTEGGSSAALNLFLLNTTTSGSGTFPGLVLKRDNRWIDDWRFHSTSVLPVPESVWKATSSWKTSRVYARKLGVDMMPLIDQIKTNPDQGEIDYVFVQPGTKISSPNQCAHEYHWNYFNRLRLSLPDNKPIFDDWYAKIPTYTDPDYSYVGIGTVPAPSQSVSIVDPETQGNCINMEIAWRYMTYEEKVGTLTKPYETAVARDADSVKEVTYGKGKGRHRVTYDFTKFYIRKRLTESTYAELMIFGLWHENYVYKGKFVSSGVWDAFNDPDGEFGTGFLIPLEMETFLTLSAREQLQLGQEALHIVFNCYKVVKEKWYETGFFQFVVLAIGFVITVISFGSLGPTVGALYGTINGALTAAGIAVTAAAVLASVLTAVIVAAVVVGVQYIAVEAGEWAAEQWGPVWGAIVQVVVTVALTWGIGQLGQTYLNIPVTPMTLTQQLMSAASFIFGGLSSYTQYEMELIKEEWDKWNAGADERDAQMKQLEQFWEENFPDMSLPAQMWLAPLEKMEDWLARTQSTTDTLVNRLIAPVEYMSEITLTPRLQ